MMTLLPSRKVGVLIFFLGLLAAIAFGLMVPTPEANGAKPVEPYATVELDGPRIKVFVDMDGATHKSLTGVTAIPLPSGAMWLIGQTDADQDGQGDRDGTFTGTITDDPSYTSVRIYAWVGKRGPKGLGGGNGFLDVYCDNDGDGVVDVGQHCVIQR